MDLIRDMESYIEAYKGAEDRLSALEKQADGVGNDERAAAKIYVEVEQTIAAVPVVFGMLNAATNLCRQELKSQADTIKRKLRFTEAARREFDESYRQKRERQEAALAKAEAQRKSEEQKAKLTNKVVVDQDTGERIAYDVYDERGEFVKRVPVKRVPIGLLPEN